MDIILFDTIARNYLFPLTLTRAVADVRAGIFTAKERWEKMAGVKVYVLTAQYLQSLYEPILPGEYIFVDARVIPSATLIDALFHLPAGAALQDDKELIGGRSAITHPPAMADIPGLFKNVSVIGNVVKIAFPAQIIRLNEAIMNADFQIITKERSSVPRIEGVQMTNPSNIFIEPGAEINFSVLNASTGPIYIGKNTIIMENCSIRGPFALCEGAVLKMGARIYGATTIGPYCTGGGEIKNSVLTGYSNKAHDGYLGDSVIGEWCNMGAGTSNSNLKNTGGEVKLWNYAANDYLPSGNKCGVIMGDYSRTAINTSINTATVIGVCCHVFANGLTPKFINDFNWGVEPESKYEFDKAIKDIGNWKKMKNKTISEIETNVLKHIFEHNNVNNTP